MSTLSELVQEGLDHQFSAAQYAPQMEKMINRAQQFVTSEVDFVELLLEHPFTLAGGVDVAPLPSRFQRTNLIVSLGPGGRQLMRGIPRHDSAVLGDGDGSPSKWELRQDGIKVFPPPRDSTDFILHYYRAPEWMNLADSPEIPEKYQDLLVHRTLTACYERENDYNSAQYHLEKFELMLAKCRQEARFQGEDLAHPRIVGD